MTYEIIDSCNFYLYITFRLSPHCLCRYYIRFKLLLVYTYDPESSFLVDFSVFQVVEESSILQHINRASAIGSSLLQRLSRYGWGTLRLYSDFPVENIESHLILNQDCLMTEPNAFEKLKRGITDSLILLLKHKETGEIVQAYFHDRIIECIYRLKESDINSKLVLDKHRFYIRCKSKSGNIKHPLCMPLVSTMPCTIKGCFCSNMGYTAICDGCNTMLHTCAHESCARNVFTFTYKQVKDRRLRDKITDTLKGHFRTAVHSKTSTSKPIQSIPMFFFPIEDIESKYGHILTLASDLLKSGTFPKDIMSLKEDNKVSCTMKLKDLEVHS